MSQFRFSAGPWNVHEGRDAFGPEVRPSIPFEDKVEKLKQLGFSAVQFHDDDAVPDMNGLSESEIRQKAHHVRKILESHGCSLNLWLRDFGKIPERPTADSLRMILLVGTSRYGERCGPSISLES